MRELPKEFAQEIYARDYIERPNFHRVVAMSPALGEKLVDAGVNAGPGRDHNQRADAILSTPAPVPGDVSASAQARVAEGLKGRATK